MKINGKQIEDINTINSMYANGNIEICINKRWLYRMSVKELLKMMNGFEFDIEKKRKYFYLVNPKLRQQ